MFSVLKFYLLTYKNLIFEKELINPIMLRYKPLEIVSQGVSLKLKNSNTGILTQIMLAIIF